ncbi:MAG: homoserine kinase [Armatimonadota bacterium]|nr:homoserine kinase [Armatimonadota bacterium]MDR5697054.1 homoserine kinase [Armatimonadota bacterium]
MNDFVRVRVPATVANLGPGFDAVGLALRLYNTVEVSAADRAEVIVMGEGSEQLPTDATNLVYAAAQEVARRAGRPDVRFALRCRNGIPLRRGLGSSAAARIAGIVGANRLLGGPLDVRGIAQLACDLEGHPDNVMAAITGGLAVVARRAEGLRWIRLIPAALPGVVVAVPDLPVDTAHARACLPSAVALPDAVFNVSRAALLVAALSAGRWDLLDVAMEDRIHQPYRAHLIPGLDEVLEAARQAGAFGAALSGAGSAVIGLAPQSAIRAVGDAMVDVFVRHGVAARAVFTEIDLGGTAVEADGVYRPLISEA